MHRWTSTKGIVMLGRRQIEKDRRRLQDPASVAEEKRGRKSDRRTSLFERRQRNMDRRRTYDEFWMGARDRRLRIMDRRRKNTF